MNSFRKMMSVLILIVMTCTAFSAYCEKAPWDCPGCDRTGNTGNFCGGCGHVAPQKETETATASNYNPPEYVDQSADFEYSLNEDYAIITGYTGNGGDVFIPATLGGKPVKIISYHPFEKTSLQSIHFPEGLAIIDDGVFSGCSELRELFLPASVRYFGWSSRSLFSLSRIDVALENKYYASVDGVLFNKSMTTLLLYPRAKANSEYVVPETVTSIKPDAFRYPNFEYSKILSKITLSPKMKTIAAEAFRGNSFLKSVIIPNGVETIKGYAFEDCDDSIHVTIPPSVKTIGKNIFRGCANPVIEGKKGSYAERYAKENNITFIPVE